MSDSGQCGLFTSKTIFVHLARGAVAAGLLLWAFLHQLSNPAFAIGACVLAMVAMRGCPACWTLGLFETAANSVRSLPRTMAKSRRQ